MTRTFDISDIGYPIFTCYTISECESKYGEYILISSCVKAANLTYTRNRSNAYKLRGELKRSLNSAVKTSWKHCAI